MRIDILLLAIVSFVGGMAVMGLWLNGDIVHYRDMYERVKAEKKAMAEDYNKRLDELGKIVGMPICMESLDISNLYPADMEPLDNQYN